MASIGVLGFLGGASGQALEAIKSRQDEERDVRKMKLLEQLRRDTAVFLADYQDKLESKKVDDKLSGFDPSTGEFINRNAKGEELGRRKDAGSQELWNREGQKFELGMEKTRADIEQSRASADASRASAAYSRGRLSLEREQLDKLGGGEDGGLTINDRANEIAGRQKKTVEDLIASGVPAEVVQMTIVRSLQNAAARNQPASVAESYFLRAAADLRHRYRGDKSSNVNKVKGLDALDIPTE